MEVIVPPLPPAVSIDFNRAFIHPSVAPTVGRNYERLEFLGDTLLELLVNLVLEEMYPNLCLNVVKHHILSNENLKQWSKFYQFSEMLKTTEKLEPQSKVPADIFEAYLGVWAENIARGDPSIQQHNFDNLQNWLKSLIMTRIKRENSKFKVLAVTSYNTNSKKASVSAITSVHGKTRTEVPKRNMISVGKALLKFIVTLLIYQSYPELDEYHMTHMRSNIFRNETLKSLPSNLPKELLYLVEPLCKGQTIATSDDAYFILGKYMTNYPNKETERLMILQCEFCFILIDDIRIARVKRILSNHENAEDIFQKMVNGLEVKLSLSSNPDEEGMRVYSASIILTNDSTRSLGLSKSHSKEDAIKNAVIKAFRNPYLQVFANKGQWQELIKFYGYNKRMGIAFF